MAQLTEKAIMRSFVRLLSEKPMEKITVKDIVDDCGITRNAFYYHFQDIYAVLDEMLSAQAKRIIESENREEKWPQVLHEIIGFIEENRKMMLHIHHSARREEFLSRFDKTVDMLVGQFLEDTSKGMPANAEDKKLLGSVFRWALRGMLSDWLENGGKTSLAKSLDRLLELMDGSLARALAFSAEGKSTAQR